MSDLDATGRQRLDLRVIQDHPGMSRRAARRAVAEGRVRVAGRIERHKGRAVAPGESVELLSEEPPAPPRGPTEPMAVEVLWYNTELVVVDKPAGVPCQPLRPHDQNTVVQIVAGRFPEVYAEGLDPLEGGLLHRLDVGTSGVLAIARGAEAHAIWRPRFGAEEIAKRYLALVAIEPTKQQHVSVSGVIDWPLARRPGRRGKMVVIRGGREPRRGAVLPALTRYRCLHRTDTHALMAVEIRRGRMHQIRVHLAALGCPLVGDALYGTADPRWPHPLLHAWEIRFAATGITEIRADPPRSLLDACRELGLHEPPTDLKESI